MLPLGRKIGNDFDIIDQIGADKAEIDDLAFSNRARDQPLCHGLVFGLGERLRIDNLQLHHAVCRHGDFFQHIAHALRLNPQAGLIGGNAARIIKFQAHRFLQTGDNIARAVAQREQTVFGQIEPRIAQRQIGEQIEA